MQAPAPDRILPLSQQLANQIAAGEVVERPASVIKELLENSIDAGAERVTVEVEGGGVRLIRVRDDGRGIHPDDLALAISPHATSKIRDHAGLERVASLGFRGEALASIASVSRLRLTSCREGAEAGWLLAADGGAAADPQPAPHPVGTTVEVRDLFYNTPARRKFLRSERTESHHLQEVVKRVALSRFGLGLHLSHNGKALLRLPPATDAAARARRVGEVVGAAFLRQGVEVAAQAGGLRLSGWLARPEAARPQADVQYFFLNGRVIRDRLVAHALRHAHRDLVAEGRHPGYVLYLELDPALVDVNVHPTKHEVRFRESRMVHDFITRAVYEALTGEVAAQPAAATAPNPAAPEQERSYGGPVAVPAARPGAGSYGGAPRQPRGRVQDGTPLDYGALFPEPRGPLSPVLAPAPSAPARALTQVGGYLLAERGGEVLVVDVAAAWRGLVRRRLQDGLAGGGLSAAPLLVPHSVRLEQRIAAHAEASAPRLRRFGVEIARIGPETVVVRGLPYLLRGVDAGTVAAALLVVAEAQDDDVLACLADHASPAQPLDAEDRERLLRDLDGLDAHTCRCLREADLAAWLGGAS